MSTAINLVCYIIIKLKLYSDVVQHSVKQGSMDVILTLTMMMMPLLLKMTYVNVVAVVMDNLISAAELAARIVLLLVLNHVKLTVE